MIYGFFLVIHIIVSILMVVAVLMQASKGGGMAGIAGTGSGNASFGGRTTATLLHKVTIGFAITFAVNCLLLSVLSKGRSVPKSVVQETSAEETFPLDFIPDADNSGVSDIDGSAALPPAEEDNNAGGE